MAIKITGYILADGLWLAIAIVKLPFAVAFAVLEEAFTRKPSVGEKFFVRSISRPLI